MYSVYIDGELLYNPRVEELQIFDPVMTFETNTTFGFDFAIYPKHPLYNRIFRLTSIIEIYQDNHLWFRGRVLDDDIGFYNDKKVICEGELAYFNDSLIRPFEYAGSVSGFLEMVILQHNQQVNDWKKFELGNVTVTDPNDYITRSSIDALKAWEVITSRLINLLGGYIMIRRENGINYIDYLEDSPYRSTQEIRLGENLIDLTKEIKGQDIVTAIIPYGAKLEDEEGEEIDERLTIAEVNDGDDFVYDEDAVEEYGWIFDTKTWDDVTLPQNLIKRGREELAKRINLIVSLDLKAIDLSMTDEEIDEIHFFEYVKTDSKAHSLDDYMLVTKMKVHLTDPTQNTLRLGVNYETFTEQQKKTDDAIREVNHKRQETETTVRDVINRTKSTFIANIEDTAESLKREVSENFTSVSDLETFEQEISTRFEQTSKTFEFSFSEMAQLIKDTEDGVRTEFEIYEKFIRFINGDIVLGEVGNEITLRLQHDRIQFLQSGAEVAYFSNNKLYVTDIEVLNELRMGSFGFIPRSNGSLDLKKVIS